MKKIRAGMYDLGTVKNGDISSLIIVNLNNATVVFNNSNRGNATAWTDIVKIIDVMRETCKPNCKFLKEKWYLLYKKFIKEVDTVEYNTMVEKMNTELI